MGDVGAREAIDAAQVAGWLEMYASAVEERSATLTELDAAIGDGDHGINMERGMRAVRERVLAGGAGQDAGALLKQSGMALLSTVGGAAGPLYGTLLMRMGEVAAGQEAIDAARLEEVLRAGVEGVRRRGKAEPGDKTMVDALQPGLDAYGKAFRRGATLPEAVAAAAEAAERGCKATIRMKALKGRASYLGERSIGHQDPGATSSALLLRTLERVLASR
ncbi:MAG: dihydroxyacetone kinase subunit DhaL [Candidatus Dormibacterales bacterium]